MTVKHQAPGRGSRWHRALQILAICLFLCCLAADARQHRGGKPQDIPGGKEEKNVPVLKEEQVSVHIPGLKNHYTFIFMSDVHIIVENDENQEGFPSSVYFPASGVFPGYLLRQQPGRRRGVSGNTLGYGQREWENQQDDRGPEAPGR